MNIYIDHGINWVFPYETVEETEETLILKELPRIHKRDITEYLASVDSYGFITLHNNGLVTVADKLKCVEITS